MKLFFGEFGGGVRSNGKALDKMKDIQVFVTAPHGEQKKVEMIQRADYWEGSFTPEAEGSYSITGMNNVRDAQDWTQHDLGITRPIQYLKTVYTVGNAKPVADTSLFLDAIVTKTSAGAYKISLLKNGKKLAKQKVVIETFGAGVAEAMTDAKGNLSVKMDSARLKIINLEWIDETPGSYNGKPYETVRHRLDLSLYP